MIKRASTLAALTSLTVALCAGAGTAVATTESPQIPNPTPKYPIATVAAATPATPTADPASPTTDPASPTTDPASPTTDPASPTTDPASPTTGPVTPTTDLPVRVAFLGDSYTWGVGASVRTNGYAFDVARAEHWDATIVGLPGSGYARVATKDDKNIAAGIPSVIAAQPQILIVECGHNDALAGIPLARTKRNSLADLRELRAALPDTKIIVIGPIWLNGHPGPKVLKVRDIIHHAQRQIPGTDWIDPIAQHWFTGTFAGRTGDDATMINYAVGHPNDLGYQNIANHLEADLQTLGIS